MCQNEQNISLEQNIDIITLVWLFATPSLIILRACKDQTKWEMVDILVGFWQNLMFELITQSLQILLHEECKKEGKQWQI